MEISRMERKTPTKPLYNLNGTEPQSLAKQYHEVILALEEVHRRMSLARPHGRDYQPKPATYLEAEREFFARLLLLERLTLDYTDLFSDAVEQG